MSEPAGIVVWSEKPDSVLVPWGIRISRYVPGVSLRDMPTMRSLYTDEKTGRMTYLVASRGAAIHLVGGLALSNLGLRDVRVEVGAWEDDLSLMTRDVFDTLLRENALLKKRVEELEGAFAGRRQ